MKTHKIHPYKVKLKLMIYVIYFILSVIPIVIFNEWLFSYPGCIILIFVIIYISFLVVYPCILIKHYYQYDKDTIIKIDQEQQVMTYVHKGKCMEISFMDIKNIYNFFRPGTGIAPHYYGILLQDRQIIIVTYLVIDYIDFFKEKVYGVYLYNLFLPNGTK